jgi:hypothetical protein
MATYNHDFVCTYQLMDDDPEMANFLYQVQLTTAFCMEQRLFSMMCDPNPATNLFDSTRIQSVFNYLVRVMKLHENKKFVDVVQTHPLVALYMRNKSDGRNEKIEKDLELVDLESDKLRDSIESKRTGDGDGDGDGDDSGSADDRQLINDSLLWLISFHSFHAFHKCVIDVLTTGSAQRITDESLAALKKTFEDFESL